MVNLRDASWKYSLIFIQVHHVLIGIGIIFYSVLESLRNIDVSKHILEKKLLNSPIYGVIITSCKNIYIKDRTQSTLFIKGSQSRQFLITKTSVEKTKAVSIMFVT